VVTGERKAPAVKNGKLRKKKGKKKKGADRWGQCAVKGRERTALGARVVKAERAKCRAGPRAVAGRCGKGAAAQASRPPSGPRGAVAGRPSGQAAEAGQRGKKKRKRGWAGSVGPKWKKMNFSKSNHFPNLFPLFPRFRSNSNVI